MPLEAPTPVESAAYHQLEWLDYSMIGAYFAGALWMAWIFSRRQHSAEEYFLGGRRMPWFAVGLSLMATLTSTVSYLATPGEVIKYGLMGAMGGLLFYPLIYLVIAYGLIPVFLRLRVTSIYEYLEQRFDVGTRMFASAIFLVVRLNWMGLVLFSSTIALAQITQVDRLLILAGIGLIAVAYTTLGGMRAVIWTDVAQFFILFGGALFTVAYVVAETGTGPGAWWQAISAADRPSQPIFSFDPFERVTLVGMGLLAFFWYVCTYAGDQVAVQRLMSTASVKEARRSSACDLISGLLVSLALAAVGLALYSYYQGQPPTDADQAFPYFIRSQLPRGLAGLVVAALFSAAMSSLDSGMNSVATAHQRGLRGTLALGAAGARSPAPAGPRSDRGGGPVVDADVPGAVSDPRGHPGQSAGVGPAGEQLPGGRAGRVVSGGDLGEALHRPDRHSGRLHGHALRSGGWLGAHLRRLPRRPPAFLHVDHSPLPAW